MVHMAVFSLAAVSLGIYVALFLAARETSVSLSPQGCEMSRMWPSYLFQSGFNESWTSLSRRYSLWLYREAGWETNELKGIPALFIPGNAGSSRQVRSIASSAAHQYYSSAYIPSREFTSRYIKPLDVFAVEFNEDLSAFHGPTLLAQQRYTADAINYILSLYPLATRVILLGHSMGGIVATSLLPSPNISAVITMSTPHSLPPARFDRRIEDVFADSAGSRKNTTTPVLSLCGGATDLMIPSESCTLPLSPAEPTTFRQTIFTSGMEGTWTGVGHQEMVWCHQVRWRVARAALELAGLRSAYDAARVLEHWFRQDIVQDATGLNLALDPSSSTTLSGWKQLRLSPPEGGLRSYILESTNRSDPLELILLASRAAIGAVSPYASSSFKVSVDLCYGLAEPSNCETLRAHTLKLLPTISWSEQFPKPGEGSKDYDGIVLFAADLPAPVTGQRRWAVIRTEDGMKESWLVAGIQATRPIVFRAGVLWFLEGSTIALDTNTLYTNILLQDFVNSALFVFQVEAQLKGSCPDALLPPLLFHNVSRFEQHFYALRPNKPIYLHSHASGPFLPRISPGLRISVFSSGECGVTHLTVRPAWWATVGRWTLRYWSAVATWAVGIVGVICLRSWFMWETGSCPRVADTMTWYITRALLPLSTLLFASSFIPAPSAFLLGNSGDGTFALIPVIVLVLSSGYVAIIWWGLEISTLVLSWIKPRIFGTLPGSSGRQGRILSLVTIVFLVVFVVPYQVAFVACFMMHISTCSVNPPQETDAMAQRKHLLLLLAVLLPLAAPVLAVWVRTLMTAGYSVRFDGDHNLLLIVFFLFAVEFASAFPSAALFARKDSRLLRYATRGLFCTLASYPLLFGARWMFGVYETANIVIACLIALRVVSG